MKYCENEAQNMIEKIKLKVNEGNLRQVIEIGEKMFLFCENTPKKSLPNRNTYLLHLFGLVRDGYYTTKAIRNSMTDEQKKTRVSIILGLPKEMQGSTDSLITQFKDYFVDKK